jgi:spermidine/putrescine transport system permease protein
VEKSQRSGISLAMPTTVFLLLFFILPLFLVLVMSVFTRGTNPSDYSTPITLENYTAIFKDPIVTIFIRSIRLALLTTLICFLVGYPLAFFISSRRNKWVGQLALFMVILPFWTNFLVRTYAWQIILQRRGILNELLVNQLHFLKDPYEYLGTEGAILLGMVYGFLPFMVLPIYANVERFNFRLVEAGYDLGANDWKVFRRVVFPLTLPGVVAGWILVFIPAIGAFVTPALLGGTKGFMIGNFIDSQFKSAGGSWPLGSGSSIAMMLIVSIALYVYLRYADEESYRRGTQKANEWSGYLVWGAAGLLMLWLIFQEDTPQALLLVVLLGVLVFARTLLVGSLLRGRTLFSSKRWELRRDLAIRRIGKIGLWITPFLSYIFLWIPIVLLIVYSFNSARRAGGTWEGFTTDWYTRIFDSASSGRASEFSTGQMLESVQTSIFVGIIATIFSVLFATSVALALVRGRFPGKKWIDGLLYLPVVIPEITMGVSLLVFFKLGFDLIEKISGDRPFPGLMTVIIGHIAFSISFVAIVIRARLTDMNPRLEEAARDLGANEWRTFRRVTYPLMLPGIISGGLLAFTLSLDDFVITFFVGGGTVTTLPVYVWGLVRRGVSPEINAVSTLMILASTALIGISLLLQSRNTGRA